MQIKEIYKAESTNSRRSGRIEKEGLMSTPSIDTKKDRQAF